jgi:hypothetical protein
MALTYSHAANESRIARLAGGAYAWFGFVVMWAFWISFVVFLANPRWAGQAWHLPTIDGTSDAGIRRDSSRHRSRTYQPVTACSIR